ncbi:HAD-IA family hydrolase [Diaphorobacter ruginosibacter]|uniref:HAD-IA family hydrolase n=1 Tax=Diaphorobacter ruginosibacter TaxID=1715720 RepID=UPI003341FB84
MGDLKNIRAVLFDLDGTLIDSAPDLGSAVDMMRVARGMPSLPLDAYRHMAGAGARGMLKVGFGMTPEHLDFPTLREEFFDNYETCIHERTYQFDGVQQLIDALVARSMPWGIVTNKATRFTSLIVQRMPLFATAGAVVSGDTTAHSKPHPEPLLEAARRIRIDPSQCLYVGDDERDIIGGKAAGMKTVAAGYGYLGENSGPRNWGADFLIDSPLDLLKLLNTD